MKHPFFSAVPSVALASVWIALILVGCSMPSGTGSGSSGSVARASASGTAATVDMPRDRASFFGVIESIDANEITLINIDRSKFERAGGRTWSGTRMGSGARSASGGGTARSSGISSAFGGSTGAGRGGFAGGPPGMGGASSSSGTVAGMTKTELARATRVRITVPIGIPIGTSSFSADGPVTLASSFSALRVGSRVSVWTADGTGSTASGHLATAVSVMPSTSSSSFRGSANQMGAMPGPPM